MNMLYGKLEWFDKNINEMMILKAQITNKIELTSFIKSMLEYTRSIKFDETPNYDYLLSLLVNVLNNNKTLEHNS